VLSDRKGESPEVASGETSGDYLQAFLLGTREALSAKNRESITITVKDCSPQTIGMLIALYDRTVGLYASLVNINAYHQPGVEAGKKAAGHILEIKQKILNALSTDKGKTVDEIACEINLENETELVVKVLIHLISNLSTGVKVASGTGFERTFIKTK